MDGKLVVHVVHYSDGDVTRTQLDVVDYLDWPAVRDAIGAGNIIIKAEIDDDDSALLGVSVVEIP